MKTNRQAGAAMRMFAIAVGVALGLVELAWLLASPLLRLERIPAEE